MWWARRCALPVVRLYVGPAPLPTLRLDERIREEVVVGLELVLGLEQPGLDVEALRVFEALSGQPQIARRDLADVLERDRKLPVVERREALFDQRQRFVLAVEHDADRLAEGAADALAQRLALHTGVGLGRDQRVG